MIKKPMQAQTIEIENLCTGNAALNCFLSPITGAALITTVAIQSILYISEGLKYIKTQPFIMKLIVVALLVNVFTAPAAQLNPLQTVRYFGEEPWRLMVGALAFSAVSAFVIPMSMAAWGSLADIFSINTLQLGCIR